jgi:hypothetical protein
MAIGHLDLSEPLFSKTKKVMFWEENKNFRIYSHFLILKNQNNRMWGCYLSCAKIIVKIK